MDSRGCDQTAEDNEQDNAIVSMAALYSQQVNKSISQA